MTELLIELLASPELTDGERNKIRSSVMLPLVGLARFTEAVTLMGKERPVPESLNMQMAFNFAVAEWGATGNIPRDLFGRVCDLAERDGNRFESANVCQCVALASWATENLDRARESLRRARENISNYPTRTFSCWRYRNVSQEEFLEDCHELSALIDGGDIIPIVLRSAPQTLS